MQSKFTLAFAETESEKEEIYRLRYRVFVEELERNDRFANHTLRVLKDPLDDYAVHLYATTAEGRVAGALRTIFRSSGPFEVEEAFDLGKFGTVAPERITLTGRLLIDPEFRMSTLMKDLCEEIAAHNIARRGIILDFLYCKPKLISLYERLGYRRYTSNFRHPDYGYETPMVLVADDRAYMKKVRSPLLRGIGDAPTQGTEDLFNSRFPQFAMIGSALNIKEADFWAHATMHLGSPPQDFIRIFNDLSEEETQVLLDKGHVIKATAGDRIIAYRERGTELYIIMDGQVEVLHPENNLTLNILGKGETFGEIAQFTRGTRNANVQARSDSTLLVLEEKHITQLMEKRPNITSKLFYNIAAMLADNLLKTDAIITQLKMSQRGEGGERVA